MSYHKCCISFELWKEFGGNFWFLIARINGDTYICLKPLLSRKDALPYIAEAFNKFTDFGNGTHPNWEVVYSDFPEVIDELINVRIWELDRDTRS